MDKHCKFCGKPSKPRHDRPGKFFTLCHDHYSEYQREKNRESYQRHQQARIERSRKYRESHPEAAKTAYQRWISLPENRDKKLKYMRHYNAPYRIHLKNSCESCGYASQASDRRDLDIHHIDGDHSNNAADNLQTLCPNCHRLVKHRHPRA